MLPLPPLPLIDGALLLDNSTLSKLNVCPKEFALSFLHKRITAGDKPALNFGGAMHLALAHRYKKHGGAATTEETQQEQNAILSAHFDASPNPVGDYRQLGLAQQMIKVYNRLIKKEDFEIVEANGTRLVESSFMLPLCEITHFEIDGDFPRGKTIPVYYTGRIDLIVQDSSGLWVLDHKTTSVMGQSLWDDMKMTPQMLGYMWACEQTLGKLPVGYIVNALRVNRPKKMDEYDDDSGVTGDDFKRMPEYKNADDIAHWKMNTIALIREFFYHYAQGYFPEKRSWCVGKYGKCQYYEVCSLPQRSQAGVLASGMFTDNVWSPLNKPESIAV